jgi:putative endopeptidase
MKVKRIVFACAMALAVSTFGASAQQAKPQYGEWGYDIAGADKATKPGDDFFRHANGTWIDKTEIPADKPGYSLRLAMTDLTEQRLHEMMEAASAKADNEPKTLDGKVGAFYKSFMDEARCRAQGEGSR